MRLNTAQEAALDVAKGEFVRGVEAASDPRTILLSVLER